ncbi:MULTISPECIES: hypothetical protein [unclassified Caulobacter]|uniref:hypothetical protein n=1 Tax=unclassified Caulobacter TaxID=2648921 RepID=UPI0011B68022|nr:MULTISPECIES: hypothetical protein [unclassified Caulobacter]
MKRVGVVCEGANDFPAIAVLVRDLFHDRYGEEAQCFPLQPAADASSRSGDGGWTKVIAWCEANSGSGLNTYLRAPLFEGEEVYDIIVLHLDGDIAEEYAVKNGMIIGDVITVEARVGFLSGELIRIAVGVSDHLNKLKAAIPTQKTESWMLAAISSQIHDWEAVESKSILLAETGFFQGKRKSEHYREMSDLMSGKGDLVRERCRSFELFCDQFLPLAPPTSAPS